MQSIRFANFIAAAVIFGVSCNAMAQYVWLNEQGVKQYSDMPPPASVPKNRVLKSPEGARPQVVSVSVSGSAASAETAPATAAKSAPTLAERNAEFNKRKMEQAEKDKKTAEEQKVAAANTRACDQARSYLQTLQAGGRITRRDAKGEIDYLTDSQRSQEIAQTRQMLAECK